MISGSGSRIIFGRNLENHLLSFRLSNICHFDPRIKSGAYPWEKSRKLTKETKSTDFSLCSK